jgi:GNAT superfamily N-acetyltransferase
MALKYGYLTEATPQAVVELNSLVAQMSRKPREMDLDYLRRVLDAPGTLVVVWDEGRIIGCAQVSIEMLISKIKGWIDEVVVDESYRGQGVAKRLMEMAIEYARRAGCGHVNLSSGSDRGSAHSVYEHLGFYQRDSAQYRLDFE